MQMPMMMRQSRAFSMPAAGTSNFRQAIPIRLTWLAGTTLGRLQAVGATAEEAAKAFARGAGMGSSRFPYGKLVWLKANSASRGGDESGGFETWGIIGDPRNGRVSLTFYIWPLSTTQSLPSTLRPAFGSAGSSGGCSSGTCSIGGR